MYELLEEKAGQQTKAEALLKAKGGNINREVKWGKSGQKQDFCQATYGIIE